MPTAGTASGYEEVKQSFAAPEAGQTTPRLSIRNVEKTFTSPSGDKVHALEQTSFDVGVGEFVGIVGPSGCGKSTLLNIVAGLETETEGKVFIDGRNDSDRRQHFSYMFQKDLLFAWRTIRENVALGLEVAGTPAKQARSRADDLLNRFGLGAFADHYPLQLSGGMRQRAALMRTLLCDRPVLLLDEPFGALDALTRANMQEWLLSIWEADHRTVLFITHDIEEAVFLSDRVMMMSARPGRIKGELPIDLDRPRDHSITTTPHFTELKKIVVDQIYEESIKATTGGGK